MSSTKVRLYKYEDVPEWQQDNHYILTGYVKETNSFFKCYESLFYIQNETVNIFTHLIPESLFPVIPASVISIPKYSNTTITDYLIFVLFFAGFSTCLSCSATFHCVKCHSYKVASVGSQVDYVGIIALIVTSMVGIIHYSLIDDPKASLIFISMVLVLGFSCLYMTLNPEFKEPHWRPFRAAMFISFGISSVFPILYGLKVYGVDQIFKRAGLVWVLGEAVGYISGAVLYAIRVPERFHPGRFDIYGNSHQIFHVLVVLSAFSHFKGLVESYRYAHTDLMN
ncbi:hypothetical protein CANARDRAFT_201316 [[Candida] arabinofermentans NRRL YB-2248]|uniref:Uncharacterized protein n=1 Tax=[Candida] arabinofermentans NRRL YB-2248 TaxID=983967 RepID=A0A1E4SY77_9ASCO|nr:hypothetical protein CANARDRAFT_201316 [[Candida] arabinofermentans NRRL YB-2248]